jgi:hypothetical protein
VKAWLALLISVCSFGAAFADAPKTSIRPFPRPALVQPLVAAVPEQVAMVLPDLARMRPLRRPVATTDAVPIATPEKPRKGLRGLLAPRAKPTKKAAASRKGSVCGVPSIKGKVLPRITSRTKGCGIDEPVSVTAVDGAKLSQPATIDCRTAIALNTWVQKGLRPAFPSSDVASLTVVDSYSCRPRNNVRGNKISEHGKGHAIDISGIAFTNGKSLTVARNFKTLRKAYKAGCGIFGTTLGPGSDGYHEDHMHFDTARQRSGGAYCR